MTIVDDGSNRLLLEVARTAWENSLLLGVLSLLCLLVTAPFVMLAAATGWFAVWGPMVLAAAPFWFVTIASGDRLLDGYGVAVRDLPVSLRRFTGIAWRISIAPACTGFVALALMNATVRHPDAWAPRFGLPLSLGVLFAIGILIGPAMTAAGRYRIGAWTAWCIAARWVVRAPMQFLGLVACYGVLIWLSMTIGPVCLLGVGLLGLLTAAISRESAGNTESNDSSRNR